MDYVKQSKMPKERISTKKEHAYSYIRAVVESEIIDRSAFQKQDKSIYIPYQNLLYFYGEYDFYCKERNIVIVAKFTTFRRAWKMLVRDKFNEDSTKVKLSSGKGTHGKCEICHNAESLLRSKRSDWSKLEKDVIKMYRRKHIEQQFNERITLQNNISSFSKFRF